MPDTEPIPTPDDQQTPEGDTFPREYVERLREESASHRTRAKEASEALEPLQQRLHALIVAGTGRLADPSDLAFDAVHLDDEAALTAAIDALLEAKPHLASRRVVGDIGQGAGEPKPEVSLAGLLAARA
jgi:hypothetical protein